MCVFCIYYYMIIMLASQCYTFSCYNDNYVWPYYIVIHIGRGSCYVCYEVIGIHLKSMVLSIREDCLLIYANATGTIGLKGQQL